MARESKFQADLKKELLRLFPGSVVLKNDPEFERGIPDLLILWRHRWAALECKAGQSAPRSAAQIHYVERMSKMSFAAFIYPENKETILNDLQLAFKAKRAARVPKPE